VVGKRLPLVVKFARFKPLLSILAHLSGIIYLTNLVFVKIGFWSYANESKKG